MNEQIQQLVCEGPCNPTVTLVDERVSEYRKSWPISDQRRRDFRGQVPLSSEILDDLRGLRHTWHVRERLGGYGRFRCMDCQHVRQSV